jgi:hypothetical protein
MQGYQNSDPSPGSFHVTGSMDWGSGQNIATVHVT